MLRVKLLEPEARLPVVAHPGEDLGYDIFLLEGVSLAARATARLRTGIAVEARRWACWCAIDRRWRRAGWRVRAG